MAFRDSKREGKKDLIPAIRSNREKLLQGGLLALLLLTCLFHLKAAFLAQLAFNGSADALYFRGELTDPNTLARLARKEHLANGDLSGARYLYSKALANFILHVPSWLGMVELFSDMGEKEQAVAALRFVEGFAADNEKTAWTKAMLAHQLDQTEIMTSNLVWLATKFPGKRRQVFALADQQWTDADALMKRFAPSLYPDILEYYIGSNDAPKAGAAWARLAAAGAGDRKSALRYVNYLLGLEEIREAARIWQEYYREGDGLLFNPELREPLLGSGFGWRISRAEGISWQPAGSGGGLRINFDGSANPSFNLAQIVPLAPGRYVFSGTAASRDLTTDQRPYWLIAGYKCDGLLVRGEMFPPSGPPDTFSYGLTVPEGCQAVQIALKRNVSRYFDNKISGTVTISGLELVAGEEQTQGPAVRAGERAKAPAASAGSARAEIGIKRMQVQ